MRAIFCAPGKEPPPLMIRSRQNPSLGSYFQTSLLPQRNKTPVSLG